ncbi:MAG TPA: hypothetical protein VNW15_13880 [Rhizomicrobium sp.]|nr:hypothetical protein [Rhizomicrobium sp.]
MAGNRSADRVDHFILRVVVWLLVGLVVNWLIRSIFVEQFVAENGIQPSHLLEDIIALMISLLMAWFFGLLGRRESWLQRGLILVLSIFMPVILLIFLLTVGCSITASMDVHGVCM